MSADPLTAPEPSQLAAMRRRESATEAMIRQIDEKLARLGNARRDRAAALNRIRCALARALQAEPAAPEHHESVD